MCSKENGKDKANKGIKNQFWLTNSMKSDGKEEPLKRLESAVSKQFLPKKQQGISEAWNKQAQESREDGKQPFSYTPFKSGTLSRPPSAAYFRGGTPNPQNSQTCLPEIHLAPTGFIGTLPKMHEAQYNPYGIYNSCAIPRPEPNVMWRGRQNGVIPPPPGPYRPASAMNPPAVTRPTSRANSEIGIGRNGLIDENGVPSHYQSYCTLPRPEQIDTDPNLTYGKEISQMAKQINALYGSKQVMPSRSASSVLAGAPGMASDYITREHSTYGGETNLPQLSEDGILKPAKEIVYFDALSLLSVFQVLCSLIIFACGVLRILWNSRWALGIELIYAILVFVTGTTGIYANSKRSYSAASATFVLSFINAVLSAVPFINGLFPALINFFPRIDREILLNPDESFIIDYLLSFVCFAEVVVAIITSIYGCKAIGSMMTHVEKLRLSAKLNAAFESSSNSMNKPSEKIQKDAEI